MKKALATGLFGLIALFALTSELQAQRCDVPAKKGMVYIAVRHAPYNSRDTIRGGTKTKIKITWGPNTFNRSFSAAGPPMTAGVLIAARHNADDSVPLFIETNGSVELCRQMDRAPSYPMYQKVNW